MPNLLKTLRFRIAFAVWWWSWLQVQAIIIHDAGFTWQTALVDSAVSNLFLGGTVYLVIVTLHHYIPTRNKYGYIAALCLMLSTIWLFISRSISFTIIGEAGYHSLWSNTILVRAAVGALVVGCMALITALWYTIQEQREIEKRKEEADQLSKQAELNNLRQQLQPHFLFNSLNSINALIAAEPKQARTMVQQLSDFLRGTLKEQNQWVTLQEEIRQLQLYLDIEKVRFGHRLSTNVNVNSTEKKLPAMLLQPLVENAIKFGLYDTTEPVTINIGATEQDGDLVVQVSNPFDPNTAYPNKGTGFGLNSVRRRLYLLFARNDLLSTEAKDNVFTCTVKIPQP